MQIGGNSHILQVCTTNLPPPLLWGSQQRPERSSPEIILPVLKIIPRSNGAVGCHNQREKILTAEVDLGIKDFMVHSIHGGPTAVVMVHCHVFRRAGLVSGV